ncbi:hypothetical protein QBC34DRAFT_379237 [Podospora aff. communis PSN243]|uniref:Uncharacterized protein n=1 Tax=Podospora aff. communis PSN243 TaxID=3040156 RepID=A0AAV9GR42_9PEZI|nr:hypothetical protein QBC34DRAFT_379237 [Podospora aff. communis PSN243]
MASVQEVLRRTKYTTYVAIFLCLWLFTAFSILYIYLPAGLQETAPGKVLTPSVTAQAVTCGFPTSGQYGKVPEVIYYLLLPSTFLLRRAQWLAVGVAASAMTYSSVASIHLILLFFQNNRFLADQTIASQCRPARLGGTDVQIPICSTLYDPDYRVAFHIVGAGLLAVLPIATWSSTFKANTARPTLVLWALLLATSHVFFNIILTNPGKNYQICPINVSEDLPESDFQAPALNDAWFDELERMTRRNYSEFDPSDSSCCIYSCFAFSESRSRQSNEIGVYDISITQSWRVPGSRSLGIGFWVAYAAMSAVALAFRKPHGANGHLSLPTTAPGPFFSSVVCVPCVLRQTVQFISIAAYVGFIAFILYTTRKIPASEGFTAIGQWSSVATVLLVLLAAGMSWMVKKLSKRPHSRAVNDGGDGDDDWTCDVGYAS